MTSYNWAPYFRLGNGFPSLACYVGWRMRADFKENSSKSSSYSSLRKKLRSVGNAISSSVFFANTKIDIKSKFAFVSSSSVDYSFCCCSKTVWRKLGQDRSCSDNCNWLVLSGVRLGLWKKSYKKSKIMYF